ncbi:Uncharacterised protein [Pseudomonas aeruginosa]|nr:Uncharacterised protein [Pseudomonas aeruginosa]
MPNLREVSLAVPGISCISPVAPTPERASDMNALSCRVMAKIQLECRPRFFASRTRVARCAIGKRMSRSSQYCAWLIERIAGKYHCMS